MIGAISGVRNRVGVATIDELDGGAGASYPVDALGRPETAVVESDHVVGCEVVPEIRTDGSHATRHVTTPSVHTHYKF